MRPLRTRAVLATASLTLLLGATLSGCGRESEEPIATEPTPESASSSPASPSAEPTVGTYPAFAHDDYDFTVRVSCFCMDAGVPVRVEVRGGKVEAASYLTKGPGHKAGQRAPEFRWVTLADIVAAANDTKAARVDVTWPSGQEYPTTVYVDQDEMMADEEIGYDVSDVEVLS